MPKLNSFGLGIAVVVVFVFTLMSAQALMIAPSPKTIYVPDNYSTIQQAVDSASPGDTIIVRDGTYIENVYIDKPYLTIRSENGSTNCIVQAANSKDYVFKVTADYVSIEGFAVKGAVLGAGINVIADHCNITNNYCTDNVKGILLWGNYNVISHNNCSWNYVGIESANSKYNIITKNTFMYNNDSGIDFIYGSDNNIVNYNTFFRNRYGVEFGSAWQSVGNVFYLNNFINNDQDVISSYYPGIRSIWNSTQPLTYIYGGKVYTGYLGNYWSCYTNVDSDGNGVWDSPYYVTGPERDYYPLVNFSENYKIIEKWWSFAIITDLHIGRYFDEDYGAKGIGLDAIDGGGQKYFLTDRLRKVVEWIIDNKTEYNIKFVIVLGDISDSGEYSELMMAKKILDKLNDAGIPYIPVIGNHDIWPYNDTTEDRSISYFALVFKDQFERLKNDLNFSLQLQSEIPQNPTPVYLVNYNFTYNGINFIVLDWVSRDPALDIRPLTKNFGVMSDADAHTLTLDWLDKSLKGSENEKVILISHHPMIKDMENGFNKEEFENVYEIIRKHRKNEMWNFAGHIHGFEKAWFKLGQDYYRDANCEYTEEFKGVTMHSVTTEAMMVGSNEETSKGVVRIVTFYGTGINATIDHDVKGVFTAFNPMIEHSPFGPLLDWLVHFTAHTFTKKTISFYYWEFGDGTSETTYLSEATHMYSSPGVYKVNLTVGNELGEQETISCKVYVSDRNPIPRIVTTTERVIAICERTWENVSHFAQNSLEKVSIFIKEKLGNPTTIQLPVGTITIHFENATQDIDLTSLIADTNLTQRKSILYMPEWPEVVEESKILYIPSTGKGAVYICKNATSLDEVNLENADVIINVGETKDGMTVLTTYYNGREYYMVLNVTGTGGGEAPSQHPYASFTYSPEYPIVNEKIIFNASSSYDPDGNITKYEWDFGDGNITEVEEPVITHTYSIAGNYTVKLTVTDDKRVKSSISRNITVRSVINQPPIANANGPYTGIEGQPVEFNASASYDPEGANLTYYWEFGDGNRTVTTQPTITHIYAQEGNYTVTLIVNDSAQNSTPSITYALINDTEPKANFTANVTSGFAPLTVQFNDSSVSYDGIIAWEWDFDGDGIVDSNEQNPIYTYDEAGTYTVSLTVHEADGDSDTETKTDYITVTSAADTEPPTIESVTLDTYINIPNASFHVTVEATDNVGVTSVTADGVALTKTGSRWEGDIFIPEGTPEGEYTLTITAQDEAGNTAESSVNYTVVFPQGGFAVAIDPMMSSASAGDVKVYQIKIISNENFDDKIHVYISDEGIPDAYKANFSFNWTDKTIYLKSGETVELSLEVTIPQASGYKMFRVYADSMRFRTSGYCTGIVLIS